jgi:hypothetical protein
MQGRDLGGHVADAQKAAADNIKLPISAYLQWSGSSERSACGWLCQLKRGRAALTICPCTDSAGL